MIRIYALILIFITAFGLKSHGSGEKGLFPVYNFTSKDYEAADQNWCIAQDLDGIMYFGNNWGLLIYDGRSWELMPISDDSEVRSIDMSQNGALYIGGVGVFGSLDYSPSGQYIFQSFSEFIEDTTIEFSEIMNTINTEEFVLFQSSEYLFQYFKANDSIIVHSLGKTFQNAFEVNNNIIITLRDTCLFTIKENKLERIQETDFFRDQDLRGITLGFDKNIIAATDNQLFTFNIDFNSLVCNKINAFHTDANRYFEDFLIYNLIRIDDNHFSCGTWGGGSVIINKDGEFTTIIDKSQNIQDQIIQSQFVDNFGNLWLGLGSGISRIEINSSISTLNDNQGLYGTIQSVTRFDDILYIASTSGLFYLENFSPYPDLKKYCSRFIKHEEFDLECWDLAVTSELDRNYLLILSNSNVYSMDQTNKKVESIYNGIPWDILQSKLDFNRLLIANDDGLVSYYYTNGRWIKELVFEDIDMPIQNISEDHQGNLWLGTFDQGVLKLHIDKLESNRISKYSITRYDGGLPEGPFIFELLDGKVIIGTNRGIFRYRLSSDNFEVDTIFGESFVESDYYIHRIKKDKQEKLWVETFSEDDNKFNLGYFKKENRTHYHSKPFNKISENIIHAIFPEDKNIWFGGSEGLFCYFETKSDTIYERFRPFLSRISFSNDSILYNLHKDLSKEKIILPYAYNSISLNFSAFNSTDETFMQYSYRLLGDEDEWSDWTSNSSKEYTHLFEGEYAFQLKARDVRNNESELLTFNFQIKAPWYRKWYSFILYLVIAAFIVYIIIELYTRNLREIIRSRTAEVVAQKNEISEKNQEITDSIQYARIIQEAILPTQHNLEKLGEHFLIFMPKDIVSGDFYWIGKWKEKQVVVVADCTGHGVPGAFMSMLAISFFNEKVPVYKNIDSSKILNDLRDYVINSLNQQGSNSENKDGMDLSLCIIDLKENKIQYSGANRPLVQIRNGEVQEIKGDRMPVGMNDKSHLNFSSSSLDIQKGDLFYMFSDGVIDQFGGPNGKKWMAKRFKNILLENCELSMQSQKRNILYAYEQWKGEEEQIDDVVVMGIKI